MTSPRVSPSAAHTGGANLSTCLPIPGVPAASALPLCLAARSGCAPNARSLAADRHHHPSSTARADHYPPICRGTRSRILCRECADPRPAWNTSLWNTLVSAGAARRHPRRPVAAACRLPWLVPDAVRPRQPRPRPRAGNLCRVPRTVRLRGLGRFPASVAAAHRDRRRPPREWPASTPQAPSRRRRGCLSDETPDPRETHPDMTANRRWRRLQRHNEFNRQELHPCVTP